MATATARPSRRVRRSDAAVLLQDGENSCGRWHPVCLGMLTPLHAPDLAEYANLASEMNDFGGKSPRLDANNLSIDDVTDWPGDGNDAQFPMTICRSSAELEKKVLWLSSWTIHHANHLRESADGLKVGGHQASSASLATIMTALYFHALRPAGPRRGQAACQPELPRDPVSARQADAREARSLSRLQGRAELSVAHQGHRRRGFLHRLGRPRRRADAVLLADAGLRARARLGDSTGPKGA